MTHKTVRLPPSRGRKQRRPFLKANFAAKYTACCFLSLVARKSPFCFFSSSCVQNRPAPSAARSTPPIWCCEQLISLIHCCFGQWPGPGEIVQPGNNRIFPPGSVAGTLSSAAIRRCGPIWVPNTVSISFQPPLACPRALVALDRPRGKRANWLGPLIFFSRIPSLQSFTLCPQCWFFARLASFPVPAKAIPPRSGPVSRPSRNALSRVSIPETFFPAPGAAFPHSAS